MRHTGHPQGAALAHREVTNPIVDYVKSIRRASPREIVVVYVPEYVVGHWYEQLLHNPDRTPARARLHFTPGVRSPRSPGSCAAPRGRRTG